MATSIVFAFGLLCAAIAAWKAVEAVPVAGYTLAEIRAATRGDAADRERALAADLALRRLEQVEQLSGLFLHLVDVARERCFNQPAPLHLATGAP